MDDIEDQRIYTDEMVLHDVRALITAGIREGPTLDYKADISEKDNWPETAVAFANTFGGLMIFGVQGRGDQPRRLTGFNPNGVEIKTKLGSTLLSRVQPRLDFQIRVVTFDQDPGKEVAILKIPQGIHPPYMHAKGDEHRVYVRAGAQKAEADYLHLMSLFERSRQSETLVGWFPTEFASSLRVSEPGEDRHSPHWYKFLLTPNDSRIMRRLTLTVERQFMQCVGQIYGYPESEGKVVRNQGISLFTRGADVLIERQYGLSVEGAIGFVSRACLRTNTGDYFVPVEF
ncbi:MAG: putative DNA binding domain-containing protein, partial [Acidobacteriia bacterium]|nr:putative DNA binding domain-containing protein [Terriglobia bacterium]